MDRRYVQVVKGTRLVRVETKFVLLTSDLTKPGIVLQELQPGFRKHCVCHYVRIKNHERGTKNSGGKLESF